MQEFTNNSDAVNRTQKTSKLDVSWKKCFIKIWGTPRPFQDNEICPVLPFLVFFLGRRQGKPPKKQGSFIPTEALKSLEKKGKKPQKTRNSSQGEKTRNSRKTRKGRTGCCQVHQDVVTLLAPQKPPPKRKQYLKSLRSDSKGTFGGHPQSSPESD